MDPPTHSRSSTRCARPTPRPRRTYWTRLRSGWPRWPSSSLPPRWLKRRSAMHSRIQGTGSYLPAQVLTNDDLAKRVDTSDEWIRTRSGIRERRIAATSEKTSDLAEKAARAALAAAGIGSADIDLIVVATTTPDMMFPSTA